MLAGVVLSSYRSLVNLVSSFREHSLLANRAFLAFYHYHTLFWAALTMLVALHFVSVYSHIQLWPQ